MKDKEANGAYKYLELLLEWGIDLDSRTVYFNDDVEPESVDRVVKSITYFESISDEPIKLKICSYGGSLDHMFALYDKIVSSSCDIVTIGTGCVCSAAVLILACGKERYITENAWIMSHNAETVGIGNPTTLLSQAKAFQAMEDIAWSLLEKHSKWPAKKWKDSAQKKGEIWMRPKQMLAAGVVDGILTSAQSFEQAHAKKTAAKKATARTTSRKPIKGAGPKPAK
jgi:ATP-dependent Clp protease protease subunit